MKIELLSHWGSDLTVVNNAKVSFDRQSEWITTITKPAEGPAFFEQTLSQGDQRLIGYLARGCTHDQWQNLIQECLVTGERQDIIDILTHVKRMPEHWAPFANGCGARFRIKAPIPIMRQLFKHKIGSVESEVSRRYVSETPEVFYPTWRQAAENVKQGSAEAFRDLYQEEIWYEYDLAVTHAIKVYDSMIKRGVCPEQARFVLPQGVYTEAIISNSLYGWARVFNQRSDRDHAQKEVADIADQIGEAMAVRFPVSWKALTK